MRALLFSIYHIIGHLLTCYGVGILVLCNIDIFLRIMAYCWKDRSITVRLRAMFHVVH